MEKEVEGRAPQRRLAARYGIGQSTILVVLPAPRNGDDKYFVSVHL
jgi:hypothetical protein